MNLEKLKSIVKSSGVSIKPHPTIEKNKRATNTPQRVFRRFSEDTPDIVEEHRLELEAQKRQEAKMARLEAQKAEEARRARLEAKKAEEAKRARLEAKKAEEAKRVRLEAQKAEEAKRAILKAQNTYIPVNEIPQLNVGNQGYKKEVAQGKPQSVAQPKPQSVAQSVAQGSWVAQKGPQKVAQKDPQKVAQKTLADLDVSKLKEEICLLQTLEARKKFVADVGFGIASEKRGKKTYLYGIKKIEGKKYRLYIGNATRL